MGDWMNFSDAEEQIDRGGIIPHRTPVKVHMKLRPGGYNDPSQGWTGGYAKRSDTAGAVFLDCEFTVMGGPFNKRKVWSNVGLYSTKGPGWGNQGRAFIRAALESARGVKADDTSERAMMARRINGFADLDGLEFCALVEVEKGEGGYDDKNKIQTVIGVGHKDYAALMGGAGTTQTATAAASHIGQQAAKSAGGTPAWLNG